MEPCALHSYCARARGETSSLCRLLHRPRWPEDILRVVLSLGPRPTHKSPFYPAISRRAWSSSPRASPSAFTRAPRLLLQYFYNSFFALHSHPTLYSRLA
ncbi:hypothetical protein J1614_011824 [Plenodomus biglobosus]|nr:hypothetical protein J1614_011824 [Plenodomus biglobosus]